MAQGAQPLGLKRLIFISKKIEILDVKKFLNLFINFMPRCVSKSFPIQHEKDF